MKKHIAIIALFIAVFVTPNGSIIDWNGNILSTPAPTVATLDKAPAKTPMEFIALKKNEQKYLTNEGSVKMCTQKSKKGVRVYVHDYMICNAAIGPGWKK